MEDKKKNYVIDFKNPIDPHPKKEIELKQYVSYFQPNVMYLNPGSVNSEELVINNLPEGVNAICVQTLPFLEDLFIKDERLDVLIIEDCNTLERVELPNELQILNCSNTAIRNFTNDLPKSLKLLTLINSNLSQIEIPDGCTRFLIGRNPKLYKVKFTTSVRSVFCTDNRDLKMIDCTPTKFSDEEFSDLNELMGPLLETIENIDGRWTEVLPSYGDFQFECNGLIRLNLPNDLPRNTDIKCMCNSLEELTVPKNTKKLICFRNKLKRLNLNDDLEILTCYGNELENINPPIDIKSIKCDSNVNISNFDTLIERESCNIEMLAKDDPEAVE